MIISQLPATTLSPYTTLFRSRGNDFPVHFHPDERKKAEQVITDSRNFNHPMLLLEATKWVSERYGSARKSSTDARSEEHTSELQSPCNLVCRLLLEKKKTYKV